MIGTLISAAVAIGSSIYSGVRSAKAAKKKQQALDKQKAENEAWYQRRYNEDPTQRADAQRLLRLTEEKIRQSNQAAAGTQAVVGGSEASVAATKEANAKALSDTMSDIAAKGEARKDKVEESYMQRKQALDNQQMTLDDERANNETQAVTSGLQGIGQAASAIDKMPNQIKKVQLSATPKDYKSELSPLQSDVAGQTYNNEVGNKGQGVERQSYNPYI